MLKSTNVLQKCYERADRRIRTYGSTLTLFMLWVLFANYTDNTSTGDDFAILAAFLYRCLDFHGCPLKF
jgi:hypothetical protein